MKKTNLILSVALSLILFAGCGGSPTSTLKEENPKTKVSGNVNSAPIATFDTFSINKDVRYDGELTATDADANKSKKVICCGLKAGTTYNFEVRAKNTAGISAPTSASGTTQDVTTPPTAPTELTAKSIGKTCLRLECKDNADNEREFLCTEDDILYGTTMCLIGESSKPT